MKTVYNDTVNPTRKKAYLNDPNKCPHCKSERIQQSREADIVDKSTNIRIKCIDCKSTWTEIYTLSNIIRLREPELPQSINFVKES